MKVIFRVLFLSSLFFMFVTSIGANSIESISMDIYVDNNGDAHVTEKWTATLTEGTEGYKPYYNIGSSVIKDFRVRDESNTYTVLDTWNVSDSFSNKAYKSGINYISDGLELCWGISSYGTHTYTLTYVITNFVSQTDDSQIIYWTLIPYELSSKPEKVYIKIYSDNAFEDTLDVWGYGNYGGLAYVYDGYIEVSNNDLDSDEYMTVLVKFPLGTFATSNILGNNFEHYKNMADEGATPYEEKSSFLDIVFGFITAFFSFGIFIFIAIISAVAAGESKIKSGTKTLYYGVTGNKVPKDVNLFRELPCGKDIYRAYWLADNYNLMKKQTDFLGAILLKWLKQDKIKIENNIVGVVFKKEDTTITFTNESQIFDNDLEKELFEFMFEASKDGILESKEFERWSKTHYSKILKWFDRVLDYQNKIIEEEGKLTPKVIKKFKICNSHVSEVDPSMMDEAIKMRGLKNFFNEFDNMKDKGAIEVKLWEEYLMYAQIFGVAEKVAKQFKEMYPDLINDYSYDSVIFLHTLSYTSMVSASTAKSRAESYSGGGGGFSSGGGGGGSFGGGGGGGGFR